MSARRIFTLIEGFDGSLAANVSVFDESGNRVSSEAVDASSLPGYLMEEGGLLGSATPSEEIPPGEAAEAEAAAKEPVKAPSSGPLPDDFPHVAFLREGGVKTWAQLRKRIKDDTLMDIDFIGPARVPDILAAVESA